MEQCALYVRICASIIALVSLMGKKLLHAAARYVIAISAAMLSLGYLKHDFGFLENILVKGILVIGGILYLWTTWLDEKHGDDC